MILQTKKVKTTFLLTILFFFGGISSISSQVSFSSNVGGSFIFGDEFGMPAFTFSPRLNIIELSGKASISVGTHCSIGLDSDVGFDFDVPALVELNFGSNSTASNESSFGAFVGAGLGYNYYTDFSDGTKVIGPIVNGGVLYGPYGLRFSAQKGVGPLFYNVYAITMFYAF